MRRSMLLLLPCFALATPASAQSSNDALRPVLERWGFPPEALSIFMGPESEARRILGPPAGEQVFPNDIYGGPAFRILKYRLSGGQSLTLQLCTDHERRERGITRPQAFCEMVLYRSSANDQVSYDDMDLLRRLAERTFGECDTTYYVFDGLIVSFSQRWADDVIVVEPFPRAGERVSAP